MFGRYIHACNRGRGDWYCFWNKKSIFFQYALPVFKELGEMFPGARAIDAVELAA